MALPDSFCFRGGGLRCCTPRVASRHAHRTTSQHCHFKSSRNPSSPDFQHHRKKMIITAYDKVKQNFSNSDNGASELARVLLERLFERTQKLEEKMNRTSDHSYKFDLNLNLDVFESDISSALSALKKKEEDLQIAERKLVLERAKLNNEKQDLERTEEEIAVARTKQKDMEEDIKKKSNDLASQACLIEDLKVLVAHQGKEIFQLQSTLSLKEDELRNLRNTLTVKNEEISRISLELDYKDQLLNEANEVINKQILEIKELQRDVRQREDKLAKSMHMRKVQEAKLRTSEINLRKQTQEWLNTRKELKKLSEQAIRNISDVNENSEEFQRVGALLLHVESELIASQKSLVSFRSELNGQTIQFAKQSKELNKQKLLLTLYDKRLADAKAEVEEERIKLQEGEAQKAEFQLQLSTERKLAEQLEEELMKERSCFKEAKKNTELLEKKLQLKELEYCDALNLLRAKESDLVDASLEINRLQSEQVSLRLTLDEKDQNLSDAQNILATTNHEVLELKVLLKAREEQLTQSIERLREKDKSILKVQNELDDAKLKFSEISTMIDRISQLTTRLVFTGNEGSVSRMGKGNSMLMALRHSGNGMNKLETELKITHELLRIKKLELAAVERALIAKDEELKAVQKQIDLKCKEAKNTKEFPSNHGNFNESHFFDPGKPGKMSTDNLEVEMLHLEATQSDVEPSINFLHNLVDVSHQLLKQSNEDRNFDIDHVVLGNAYLEMSIASLMSMDWTSECLELIETEVGDLLATTEKLVDEAGLSSTDFYK